jgi:Double-GTPase 2
VSRHCLNLGCSAGDGESCALGHINLAECPSWETIATESAEAPTALSAIAARVPWSGSALGLTDLGNLVPRGRSILVGVMGEHDAGKTTLLTGSYLQLLRGRTLAAARFAGSRTLGAWESLAAWTRFNDAARPPSFPPHTPRGTARVPGMLHLALRGPEQELRDVLLTDAPGEWFSSWAVHEGDPEAEGARWVVKHADALLVFADCQRLCGPKRGEAKSKLRELLERLGNHVAKRPTVLVWAKKDHVPKKTMLDDIRETLRERIPHATEVEATTNEPETLSNALEAVLHPAWMPPFALPVVEPVLQNNPFAAFRGIRAYS